ncbi:protein-disulfide reductase DsbD family protein [Granulicella tundricola]|uniref:Protein-disulfide reductase n=1 Tax=Granulicella tundricola (strain ATCC BAA-1859 / DSM 23138 / MP5ACTX9) TaxID=1198114 RepID=E8X4K2_GRATM|nr:thioredoxin family protein [Granulicella tundricola]ADW69412.1 Protein-disulfide reductase [Granulicella tundricola MP5ACTX9]
MNLRRPRLALTALFVFLLASLSASAQIQEIGDGGPGPVKGQHITAEMVSLAPSVSPGGTVQVGLVLTMEEHWHVYWMNAGDSGQPPKVIWTLPSGITAGPMQFPIPQRLPLGPLMDFGYEDLVTFPMDISVASSAKPGPVHLDAKINWLVCREVCIPGKAHLGLTLNVAQNSPAGQPVGALGQALKLIPKPLPAGMSTAITAGRTDIILTLKGGSKETDAEFYPYDQDQILNAPDQDVVPTADGVSVRLKRAAELTALPLTIRGVLKFSDDEAYEIVAPVKAGEVAFAGTPAKNASAASGVTAIGAIGLAFLGGIILNLMPCVFPVLFLKGLALVQSSGEERKRLRSHGMVYTLGILVSFWVIVGVLLALRAGGSQAGWGFQLQSPVFIALLASGLFLFALSLAGQFDVGLSMTSVGGDLAKKQGYTGSFFTGVLATIVATPCTAPLMGAAIGFALAQPAGITFAVFTALGLGLAVPYLVLSFQPAWTRILPRPGAWMEVLKQLTAVPLFATVIWLAWVYGQLFSAQPGEAADHIARLLCCFLVLAIAGWALGRWPLNWRSTVAAVVLCVVAIAIPLTTPKPLVLKAVPYSQAALDEARAAGHPVFIDFTAAWCLSCQVNEKLVLHASDVESELTSHNFVVMRADWTAYDPEITKQLASINRSGVPTYVIYPAKGNADVLPELLTKSVVLDAIQRDSK